MALRQASPVIGMERGAGLEGLRLLARVDGRCMVAGAPEAPFWSWLARPLRGSFFVERALASYGGADELVFAPPPSCPLDWASPHRALGRRVRQASRGRSWVLLNSERAHTPLEQKANGHQLTRLKKTGALKFEIRSAHGTPAVLETGRQWALERMRSQGLPIPPGHAHRMTLLSLLADDPACVVSTLSQGHHIISVAAGWRDGDCFCVELMAESPQLESASPSLIHFFFLEEVLAKRGVRRCEVSRGPDWLRYMASEKDGQEVRILYRPTARVGQDVAEGAVRWARKALHWLEG